MNDPNETMLFTVHPKTGKYHVPECRYAVPEGQIVALTAMDYDVSWSKQCWVCRPQYGSIRVYVWGEGW